MPLPWVIYFFPKRYLIFNEEEEEMKGILIVDDEQDVLSILEKKFRENNYNVMAYARGGEAIEACKLNKPDIMLIDIAMPEMDGYTLALALRKEKTLESVPIIFMTGKELEYSGIEKRVHELGVHDFIIKPCNFQDLLAKVKEVIG